MKRNSIAVVFFLSCLFAVGGAFGVENATITGDAVRIREDAGTDAPVVTTLNKGARVEVVNRMSLYQTIGGSSAYWYYINYRDASGYVFGKFIAIDPAAAPTFEPVIDPGGPRVPYEDWGACPFECCTYRKWSVNKDTPVKSGRSDAAPVVFVAKAGDWVTAITGIVITTTPGKSVVKVPMTLGSLPAVPGDVLELFTYQGEGFYKAWFKGQLLDGVEAYGDIVLTVMPVSVWWVKMSDSTGKVGWTRETGNFGDNYGCGD
jgi:hypothetical protein